MAKDYTKIDNPYNSNLDRTDEGILGQIQPSMGSGQITSPSEVSQNIVDGSTVGNMYIESWIKSRNYKPKTLGFFLDGASGYIEAMKLYIGGGGIVGGKLDIPDETTANSFHVDADGNTWWGTNVATGHATAPAKVLNTGAATFSNMTVTGGDLGGWNIVAGYIYSLASGTPTSTPNDGLVLASVNEGMIVYENTEKRVEVGYLSAGVYGLKVYDDDGSTVIFEASDTQKLIKGPMIGSGSEIAIQDWVHDMVFSVTDANTVAWGSGTITLMNGDTFSIDAGNTGNMAAQTYVYLSVGDSITALQTTTTKSTANGSGKFIVAVCEDGTDEPTFTVFGSSKEININAGDSIVVDSITVNEMGVNSVTATEINVAYLSAINADMGAITAGTLTIDTSGYVRGGQSAYNTGVGFFIGYDVDAYKLSLGDPNGKHLLWTGADLIISGYKVFTQRTQIWTDTFTTVHDDLEIAATDLTVAASATDTDLTVTSSSGFTVGEWIDITDGIDYERRQISSIPDGTSIIITSGLTYDHDVGSLVGRYMCKINAAATAEHDGSDGWLWIASTAINHDTAPTVAPANATWAVVYLNIVGPQGTFFTQVHMHKEKIPNVTVQEIQDLGAGSAAAANLVWSGNTVTLTETGDSTGASGTVHFFDDGSFSTGSDETMGFADDVDLGDGSDGALSTSGAVAWDDDKDYTSVTLSAGAVATLQEGEVRIIKCQGTFTLAGTITGKGKGDDGGVEPKGPPSEDGDGDGGGEGAGEGGSHGFDYNGGGGAGEYGGNATAGGVGGFGGHPGDAGGVHGQENFDEDTIKLGSGGAAGGPGWNGSTTVLGGPGGHGGGALIIYCRRFVQTGSGEIDMDGVDGTAGDNITPGTQRAGCGGGAGGSGGSIYIRSIVREILGTSNIHADGGTGAAGGTSDYNGGTGGNGGDGRIRIESNDITGTTSPTFYSLGDLLRTTTFEGSYYAALTYQKKISNLTFEITRNTTVVYHPDVTVDAAQADVQIDGDKTDELVAGDTIDLYDVNNFTRERKIIDSLDYNVTEAGKTTITCDSNFDNEYLTTGWMARIDFIPYCSILNSATDEDTTAMIYQESEIDGTKTTDYYTYQTLTGGNYIVFKIYLSRNKVDLTPYCYNFDVALNQ